ncbi:hypothetical protein GMOD_00003861 [Pyrenophora seminiperda CCB06]|uniref:BZIP domain-containing protein n=1 Tax=Pyrenophora seminiperda CCB06 TaxID=1302712 RepID=A0A3M7LZY7_9PLEO|nr:hypothetical protein GMOD_00003861 [Pyrenophora seminiperda CCB06]
MCARITEWRSNAFQKLAMNKITPNANLVYNGFANDCAQFVEKRKNKPSLNFNTRYCDSTTGIVSPTPSFSPEITKSSKASLRNNRKHAANQPAQRRKRNRESQRKSRQRVKDRIDTLRHENIELELDNLSLQERLLDTLAAIGVLRKGTSSYQTFIFEQRVHY